MGEIKNGPDAFSSEPFLVIQFKNRDGLPDPRPGVSSGAVVSSLRKNEDVLLDVIQFRSQRQEFCFRSQSAWILWVESNASQVMPNAKAHHVITCKLLAG